ncbi:MAG: 3'-5' exonuclease [Acidobacteriota bacterium]|jgi:predicted PolB exonuclease-like 3'-5' exonuclease|nr:3'-5' exonuclease [Acidobacteriota bacterium]NLT32592.1 3'-5' exonuclease [Acidobacteriota bacterium]
MVQYLVFDIETRVDKELVKEVYDPENNLTLDQAYDTARDRILEKSNQQSDFFPIPFHIPIAISTMQVDENYRILSLGCLGADRYTEEEMVARFWSIFESARTLVTFNGRGFDLPVLETRALKFALPLPRYFGADQGRSTYRGSRYSDAYHIDLCDFLSNFGAAHRRSSLDILTRLIGLPGKYSIEGDDVEYLYRQGRQKEINQYCVTDVVQTYLLFLRVELLRGRMTPERYGQAVAAARAALAERAAGAEPDNFLQDFLARCRFPEEPADS